MTKVVPLIPKSVPPNTAQEIRKIKNIGFARAVLSLCLRAGNGEFVRHMDTVDAWGLLEKAKRNLPILTTSRERVRLALVWVNPNL